MKYFAIAFLLLLSGLLLSLPLSAQEDPQMKRGQQALRAQKYDQALAYFDAVVKRNDHYPQVYVYRGLAHYALEDYFNAEVDFQRALDQGQDLTKVDAAKLHNNRGMALYFLKEYEDAANEFRQAYRLDPNLNVAEENYQKAKSAERNPTQAFRPGQPELPASSSSAYDGLYRDARPQINYQPAEQASLSEARAAREQRLVVQNLESGRYKPFKSRRIWATSKTYKRPAYAAASQAYVEIVEVVVGRSETRVVLRVENPSLKEASFCIAPPSRRESFYLTDRSGKLSGRMAMREIIDQSISTCPAKSRLAPGEKMTFTLRFDKIPSDVGYVSLIEGNRKDGNQWNFYDIDLTD
jgi:tetratricopeptide (TPR) repeat protein